MIRLLIIIVVFAALSLGVDWMLQHDGVLTLEWMGYRVRTSAAFLLFVLAAVMVLLGIVLLSYMGLRLWAMRLQQKHAVGGVQKGLAQLRMGFVALAAGQYDKADKAASRATKYLGQEPLALMVQAQAQHLQGNSARAASLFQALTEQEGARILGVKGLLTSMQNTGDNAAALKVIEELHTNYPHSEELLLSRYDLYKHAQRWDDALTLLEARSRRKAFSARFVSDIDKKRERAILHYLKARHHFMRGEQDMGLESAAKAYKLLPSFSPGVYWYAEGLQSAGQEDKALSLIEKIWKENSKPFLADLYLRILSSPFYSGNMRKRVEKLAKKNPKHIQSLRVLALEALQRPDTDRAREVLTELLAQRQTIQACLLMAEAEKKTEHADMHRVQEWNERAMIAEPDAAWHCRNCGYVTQHWEYSCRQCQTMDSLSWSDAPSARADQTALN